MNMLSKGFPAAQMLVCGVLGPKSNAHGPNEFLHVPYAKKLTAAVAQVMALMEQGYFNAEKLVTKRIALDDIVTEGFEALVAEKSHVKILVEAPA